jgi:hypothetical protein
MEFAYRRRLAIGTWLLGVPLVGMVVIGMAPRAFAQEEPAPTVQAASITVDHADDGTSSVEATFELGDVGEEGIEHLLVHRAGVTVQDLMVDGEAIEVPDQSDGISRVATPISGEQVSYTVTYTVSRDDGVFAVPILTPEAPRDASNRAVSVDVLLPPDMVLAGEAFPSVERREQRDGREVVAHRVINVPTVTITEYGAGERFELSSWITVVALLLFAAVVILWYRQSLAGRTSE